MNNRDIYLRSPRDHKLINEGVANVNDDRTPDALCVLRYELETFVCDGQYEKGLRTVLETFLKNINESQQPAVWVSGFYGAGKSHLVKMLRTLWKNEPFSDGVTPRDAADLPANIRDLLSELDCQAARHGGKHAASGTLGAAAHGSVRLALLRLIFKSTGLPERYPQARFVMWLRNEGILSDAMRLVGEDGFDWNAELENFYLSEAIHRALRALRPNQFAQALSCADILSSAYKSADDVSSSEMTRAISDSIRGFSQTGTPGGEFPLTMIVLDELQQYIGTDASRSLDVQEAVESCCRNFCGKLLFIGTGQTAITGTINLKKLEGRFTVRVELSDADADTVIRKVILAKRPEAKPAIEKVMADNLAEIRRGLSGTIIGHRKEDIRYFADYYPLLPARGRFWNGVLRALDQTGTDSQLRNRLGMIHKAIGTNLDEPLGNILPADYIYFELADRLLQARVLPRRIHEKTSEWRFASDEERLMARACGLVFLINKLAENNPEMGLSANLGTLADLMMDDLQIGSATLRDALPNALNRCVSEKILMRVGEAFRVQTEESVAWNDEFEGMRAALVNETHRIDAARDDYIRAMLSDTLGRNGRSILSIPQGKLRIPRSVRTVYDTAVPEDSEKKITVWVRDGWKTDEESLINDARLAGGDSPTVFVFIPCASDELQQGIIDYKAALWTLDKMGRPSSPEGIEARGAMETIKALANARIEELLGQSFAAAKVFSGGGGAVCGANLREAVLEASRVSVSRLYPEFDDADQEGWAKVCESAQRGSANALEFLSGGAADYQKNPVCGAISAFLSQKRSGAEIRKNFESPPYGWPRDAVDGGIFVLLRAGAIKALDDRGLTADHRALGRSAVAGATFKIESVSLTAREKVEVRKLMHMADVQVSTDEELSSAEAFLRRLMNMAENAGGGTAPLPFRPDTVLIRLISGMSGNERLRAMYESRDEIKSLITDWRERAEAIERKLPAWDTAKKLLAACGDLPGTGDIAHRLRDAEDRRGLLDDPDPIPPVIDALSQILREELLRLENEYGTTYDEGVRKLRGDERWQALDVDRRSEIIQSQSLGVASKPVVMTESPADILNTLSKCSIQSFSDRVAALPSRFDAALASAGGLSSSLSPESARTEITVLRRSFRTEEEIDAWVGEISSQLKEALKDGAVYIR
ncbi:MAG: BREX system P-loop protein BrxC [Synergistaceae bacterium]|jgi:hypothetical protein|nr:BREX system P-loop protein BrxC [Synergistaceae bacterium]